MNLTKAKELLSLINDEESWVHKDDLSKMWSIIKDDRTISTVVEIGCWKGRTSCWFMLALDGRDGTVISVDPMTGSPEHTDRQRENLFRICKENIDLLSLECDTKHALVVCESDRFTPPKHDLLFIDGDHSYEQVKRDVLRYGLYVRVGGYLILDDTAYWDGPKAVSTEIGEGWELVHSGVNMMVWRKV